MQAAKLGATADLVSQGRWGLNVVSGWRASEFEMFGLEMKDRARRYAYADEWLSIVNRLWTENEEFDHKGEFFDLKGLIGYPQPVQNPRPTVMNAGTSAEGIDFASRNADMIFVSLFFPDDQIVAHIKSIREAAAAEGRNIQIWGILGIACRPTQREAEEYVEHYAVTHGDELGAARYAADVMGNDSGSMEGMRADPALLQSLIRSSGNLHFVGTPQCLVDEIRRLSELGLDGIGLSWIDYEAGLDQFNNEIMPMLIDAGLRTQL